MSGPLPSHCQIALKEWASVVQALARGEQLVLIRKGGLIEPTSGFTLLSEAFVFYPTFEHQTSQFLRQPYIQYLQEALARKPADGQVRFDICGLAVLAVHTADPEMIQRLEPFHIYNEAFLEQRLKWQPDQPLAVTVIRTFRLPSPHCLPIASRYTGCKSWVELEQAVCFQGAKPVLNDPAFDEQLQRIRRVLAASREETG